MRKTYLSFLVMLMLCSSLFVVGCTKYIDLLPPEDLEEIQNIVESVERGEVDFEVALKGLNTIARRFTDSPEGFDFFTKQVTFPDGAILSLNRDTWETYALFAYGSVAAGATDIDGLGTRRHLGRTRTDSTMTSGTFLADFWPGGARAFDDRHWIEEPWLEDAPNRIFKRLFGRNLNRESPFLYGNYEGCEEEIKQRGELISDSFRLAMLRRQPPEEFFNRENIRKYLRQDFRGDNNARLWGTSQRTVEGIITELEDAMERHKNLWGESFEPKFARNASSTFYIPFNDCLGENGEGKHWERYIYVTQLPTYNERGMGVMFHEVSGRTFYWSVHLAALKDFRYVYEPDFKIVNIEPCIDSNLTKVGNPTYEGMEENKSYTGRVTFKLDSWLNPQCIKADLYLEINGEKVQLELERVVFDNFGFDLGITERSFASSENNGVLTIGVREDLEPMSLSHMEVTFTFNWEGSAKETIIKAEVQPNEEHFNSVKNDLIPGAAFADVRPKNNVMEVTIVGGKIELPDFSVTITPRFVEDAVPGNRTSGTATFLLCANHPQNETTSISLVHRVGNTNHNIGTETREFQPGVPQNVPFAVTVQDVLMTEVIAEIANSDPVLDINIYNNRAVKSIFKRIERPAPPRIGVQGDATLTFQAESRWDGKERQPGTAKWTDNVRATLTVPTPGWTHRDTPNPIPSRSDVTEFERRLVHIKVTEATLSVPRAHSDFAFGNPVTPIWGGGFWRNPVQRSFITGAQTVTTDFVQNWSLAGTNMFVVLWDEMMCPARDYPVRANYNMEIRTRHRWYMIVGWRSHCSCACPYCCGNCDHDPIWGWTAWEYVTHPFNNFRTVRSIHVNGTGTWPVGQ